MVMLTPCVLTPSSGFTHCERHVCFATHSFQAVRGWYKDNSADASHAWMCVIWYDRLCCRQRFSESSSHSSHRRSACVCACVHILLRWGAGEHVLDACLCARPVSRSAGGWRHAYVCTLKLARYPIVCVLSAFMRCDSQLQGSLTLMMLHSTRDFFLPELKTCSSCYDYNDASRFGRPHKEGAGTRCCPIRLTPIRLISSLFYFQKHECHPLSNKWNDHLVLVLSLLILPYECLFTGGCTMRRRATPANTVANTSRTACVSGCTCCLTQVFSNSHTHHREFSADQPSVVLLSLKYTCSPSPKAVNAAPNTWIILSFSCLGLCSSPFSSSLRLSLHLNPSLCFFGDAGSSPALPLLSDDIISCRQAWVFCQCSEACVMARSQMCVQEHTVPKCRLNQTWLLSQLLYPK